MVPSGLFWPFFQFFSQKERIPLNQFFWRDHLNDRWAFFYQLMLISRSLSKGLIFRTQKPEGRFDPKKIFFRLFNAETTLNCFSRRKKIFFEKKIFRNFWNFRLVWRQTSKRRRPQLWPLYTKKLCVTFLFIMLKNLIC